MKTILIDHDDSFTFNLRDWLKPISDEVEVINHRDVEKSLFAHLVVLSPGPKTPQDYPQVLEFINNLSTRTSLFGVCLGLQMMVHSCGGLVKPYAPPLHGKKSKLTVTDPVFKTLHNHEVARYHSLCCEQIDANQFETLATSQDDNLPMWLRHKTKKWMGVQFHPESFLTDKPELHQRALKNWLSQ